MHEMPSSIKMTDDDSKTTPSLATKEAKHISATPSFHSSSYHPVASSTNASQSSFTFYQPLPPSGVFVFGQGATATKTPNAVVDKLESSSTYVNESYPS